MIAAAAPCRSAVPPTPPGKESTCYPTQRYAELDKADDTALAHAESDLEQVAGVVSDAGAARICLYGPAGTRKSAYALHRARQRGPTLRTRRAPYMLSKCVGESGKRIPRAFLDAQREGATLMIDEVDGLMQGRQYAARHWKVTQVNELLMQLDAIEGVLIATANLLERVDPAALHCFDLKIGFDDLRPEQARALLERECSLKHMPVRRAGFV